MRTLCTAVAIAFLFPLPGLPGPVEKIRFAREFGIHFQKWGFNQVTEEWFQYSRDEQGEKLRRTYRKKFKDRVQDGCARNQLRAAYRLLDSRPALRDQVRDLGVSVIAPVVHDFRESGPGRGFRTGPRRHPDYPRELMLPVRLTLQGGKPHCEWADEKKLVRMLDAMAKAFQDGMRANPAVVRRSGNALVWDEAFQATLDQALAQAAEGRPAPAEGAARATDASELPSPAAAEQRY